MKFLTPFLIMFMLSLCGLQNMQAQIDMGGFERLFTAASKTTDPPRQPLGGGGTTMPDNPPTDDRDGGGSVDMINANWPVKGKMIARSTNLSWDEGIQPTKITLKQGAELIFTAPVSGNSITVDFSQMNLDSTRSYNLQLTNDVKKSKRTAITFVSQKDVNEALAKLEADITYKKADGVKKKLMKAFYLEKNEFNYEAYEAYHIPTSNPRDMNIILTFFNAFKSRT